MGCVCKCACVPEKEVNPSGVILKIADDSEYSPFVHTELHDKEVSVSSFKTSPSGHQYSSLFLPAPQEDEDPFSMRKMLAMWHEKLYSGLKGRSSPSSSDVSYIFPGDVLTEGSLLEYKEECANLFIERWCRLSREDFRIYKSRYHATHSFDRPLEVFDLGTVKFAANAQIPENFRQNYPFQFEVFLKNSRNSGRISSFNSFSGEKPPLNRSFTVKSLVMPLGSPKKTAGVQGRMVFCVKSSKDRDLWIQAFNEHL